MKKIIDVLRQDRFDKLDFYEIIRDISTGKTGYSYDSKHNGLMMTKNRRFFTRKAGFHSKIITDNEKEKKRIVVILQKKNIEWKKRSDNIFFYNRFLLKKVISGYEVHLEKLFLGEVVTIPGSWEFLS